MKEMLINVSEGEECRIALVEDGRLEELYMERTSATSHVGNIYKGRVTNVEASIQAAFVDFGLGRNGFLHISDLMPSYFGRQGSDFQETVGRKLSRRDRPPIQRCLRRGDEIIVQIIKEGIGTKGPTLSTYLSIPGKILVMMPGMGKMGVSKKIEDEGERRRLRQILDGLQPPDDLAFIIRTAGIGKTKLEIERDLTYLTRLWETILDRQQQTGPVELYTEGDLVARTVRDVYSADVDRIVVDNWDVAKSVKDVLKISNPRGRNRVEVYEQDVPLFHKYGIEREIELMYSRHVPLASGGSLVIDSTEAVVAIDVNSGKFRDHSDAETTAFKIDMEAADEITRQLKLRDLGGVIICDFIDLRYERHRRELEERLHENFKNDRAKTKVLRMSQFGIIEITRQRMRPSLKRSIYADCPHCKGAGLVKTPESMALDVMRKLAIALADLKVVRVQLSVGSDVAIYLLNKKRAALAELEHHTEKSIVIQPDPALGLDEQKFELFDARDGIVVLEELGMTLPGHGSQMSAPPRGSSSRSNGRPDSARGGRGGRSGGVGRTDSRALPTRSTDDDDAPDEDRITEDDQGANDSSSNLDETYGREEDSPDLSPVLETEAGDQIAEELADEELEADDDGEPVRAFEPQRPTGDRNGGDRNGGDRNGGDRNGGDRNGGDRNGGDRNGGDRNGGGGRGDNRSNRGDDRGGRQGGGGRGGRPDNRPDNRPDIRPLRPAVASAFAPRVVSDEPVARGGGARGGGEGAGVDAPVGDRSEAGAPLGDRGGFDESQGGEGGGRRRRRRRGRRGRGRGDNDNGGRFDGPVHDDAGNAPLPADDEDDQDGPTARPPRPLSMAEMAGKIAGELANEMDGFGSDVDDDAPPRAGAVGTSNQVEPSDAVGPAAEGGESITSEQVNFGEVGLDEPEGVDDALNEAADDQPRRRRRRGGRRHRRRGAGTAEGEAGPSAEGSTPLDEVDLSDVDGDGEATPTAEVAPEETLAPADTVDADAGDVTEAEPAEEARPRRTRSRASATTKRTPPRTRGRAKAEPTEAPPDASGESSATGPKHEPITVETGTVVPTGTADTHLGTDEPVEAEPLPQPRSYGDLDAIPDDYD